MRSPQSAVLAGLLAACELEEVAIPPTDAQVAVHGVLSATAATQVVVLERTRAGVVGIIGPPVDLPDPTVRDEGIAETGALVTLTTPAGQTLVAPEDASVNGGFGAGIYRFPLSGSALERGGSYRLSVRTTKGEVLSAETSVPDGAPATLAEQRRFDRARDTLIIEWSPAARARSYLVRVETPFGPRTFFTDSLRVRLTGELRNVDLDALPRVFIPGFPQAVTVSAVDSNFYDWYRTHNDAFSASGLVNRVRGGMGVFGSLVRLRFEELEVVAPQAEQGTGRFRLVSGDAVEEASSPYLGFELYVESRAARSDQANALSGRSQKRLRIGEPDPIRGVLGTASGTRVELAFLRRWSARDTLDTFSGEIRGDTIAGRFHGVGGVVHFVRER